MDRTPAAHANHDELLLARLYGGDVDERERATALDLMAGCSECADFFADLGAIAAATVALPTPPRPRDFSLTEADAARLRRRSAASSLFGLIERTRVIGRGMVAVGLAGAVLVVSVSAFLPGAGNSGHTVPTTAGAPAEDGSAPVFAVASPNLAPESSGADRASAGAGAVSLNGGPTPVATSAATSAVMPPTSAMPATATQPPVPDAGSPKAQGPAAPTAPATSREASGSDGKAGGPVAIANGSPAPNPPAETAESVGPDLRTVGLAAFAGLLILGLMLVAATRFAARRSGS